LAGHIDSIHAFCAGSEGDFSLEDTLCAGALLEEFAGDLTASEYAFIQSDTAKAARSLYHGGGNIGEALGSTSHAQYLASIGFGADVAFASELGSSRMIPLRRADGSLIHWHNPLNL
jgi:2-phosphosulfolactate phosphatase